MSDLSAPPTALMPDDDSPNAAKAAAFAWPTPALPCYPAPAEPVLDQPCEIEGLNGKTISGRLRGFDPQAGQVLVHVPQTRSIAALRMSQFRLLRLTRPLGAAPPAGLGLDSATALAQRPTVLFSLKLRGGTVIEGRSIAPLETEYGIFLFEPIDEAGTVRRSFIPRALLDGSSIGPRIGESLVAQGAATPEQVQQGLEAQRALRGNRLGELLLVRLVVTPTELTEAIDHQAHMPMVRIGEALLALGFVSRAQLDEALEQQRRDRSVPLGELLVRRGLVSRRDLQTALARKMGYPMVDAARFATDVEALQRLPAALALRLSALPLMVHGGRLVVALEDPTRAADLDELEFATQGKVVAVLAPAGTLGPAVERAYERLSGLGPKPSSGAARPSEPDAENAGSLLASLERQGGGGDDETQIEQSDNSLVRLINSMILEAQARGVSDIHVETQPGREKVRIRFRKDGQLRLYMELPPGYRNALLARLKIMCDLDISERRKPQDGKISFGRFVQGQKLELRVATIPTHGGLEDAVLRLLASAKPIPLDQLGLSPTNFVRLQTEIRRPCGIILCVGPTGSGKTTTLHSALGWINTPERKIWTAEDPIEITQAGLRQVQVNPKIDWTFEKALRSFLRADPDVVMVGEIRDRETAQVAIEASLTGHLVLSTLHTNSAPETVTRLLDMGMDPFNFADALRCIIAQRLVRRLCPDCKTPYEPGEAEIDELRRDHERARGGEAGPAGDPALLAEWRQRFGDDTGRLKLYRPAGCARCDQTGYSGRIGIHELMPISREMKQMIQTTSRASELQRHALAEGMRTLRQDGIEKVLAGLTTIDEVRAISD
ncbi:MAG: Flp pilus assembly complex ATPase component TadA [Burkholderiales bacterium]|nr:Flp pilus assembly complex ATPase component TadA [Burkholderiales bacterium]